MLCKVCSHCGLCEGDGINGSSQIETLKSFNNKFKGLKNHSANQIGIAVDLGTTTIAAAAFSLYDGRLLYSCGKKNPQAEKGQDVISRIKYSSETGGSFLSEILLKSVNELLSEIIKTVSVKFLAERKGAAKLEKIVMAGNTVMESFAFNINVKPLGEFPFTVPEYFGKSEEAGIIFKNLKLDFSPEVPVYFAPCISAFIGGDALCAALSSVDFLKEEFSLVADAGTNCEVSLYNPKEKLFTFTSCSAGPAFEGQGIECGSTAIPGAIADVRFNGEELVLKTVNAKEPLSICGTGIISAAAALLKKGIINSLGTFAEGDKYFFTEKVYISQKDIRNLQLAKSAVRTGLDFLTENFSLEEKNNAVLYFAGGFGTKINPSDALSIGMIPDYFKDRIFSVGNACLSGASLMFDEDFFNDAKEIASNSKFLNLAEMESFQKMFINNLNF